ncbi:protein LONGIFOLIA 2 isoform X1 [Brassica napus]|uniref:protein LONGIFOLIA 2 isoform X1 n=1 Tax=Brassica oleracea var. oleracea TaxID=109376 RepID=UPI0006A6E1FE|nr:PREDICTED: protein LONGIFOLIA 2 isoform X1 [Brassica oleracea var. oleracea]XP_048614289.1 protein LONGIFOLIA 2 isoform X1 [Brassica napus]
MSAKLLHNLSDENPNLNKQFGCMNGIFQVFHRQQYPARPVYSDVEKSLPPGERKDLVGDINMESDKETKLQGKSTKKKKKSAVKKKHRASSESSSRPSFSSSPRSSSFSSTEVSTTASQFDQPGETQVREQPNVVPMMPFDLKELVKGSINREMRTRRQETAAFTQQQQPNSARTSSNEWNEGRGRALKFKESHRLSYDEREMRNNGYKMGPKLKETPRLSLDSRSSPPPTVSHRRSSSSIVAKLMGLEVIADNFAAEQRKENLFCDSPRPQPTALQRSRSVGSIKKILPASSKFPMEPAPWKQMKAGDAAPTVYGEIQKRLTQLEFNKAGKDLRALKQILEAMEKTQKTHQLVPAATSPAAMNSKSTSIVVMKPAAPVSTSSLQQKAALPNVNVGNTRQTQKVTSGKQNIDSTKSTSTKPIRSRQTLVAKSGKSQQQSVSPRMQPKKLGFERQSRPTTPKSEPGKIQRQLGSRQHTESVSPRRKQGIIKPRSTLQQPDDRLSDASSDLRSLRSDSNISLGSNVDIEVTSKHRLERNCDFTELHTPKQRNPDFRTEQDRPSLKPLKVTVEQPSPVSVLDAAFDEEDSPSPVRKISLSFKEDDELRSEASMWINKPTGVCRSILLPENKGPTQTDSDLLECFPNEDANFKSGDHKYISEILLASGLLKDLEYSKLSIQLNQARLPINPGLFFFLEQNKDSNMTLLDNKHRGRGFSQQQTNLTEKIRRKLVFDTVNEILAQRFTAEGCTKPRFTANPVATMENKSKGEKLLQSLCSEIDRLQENKSKCILEDDEEDIIWEDLQCHRMNLKEFEGENPGIVLDIERMIFRDLVSEVCFC